MRKELSKAEVNSEIFLQVMQCTELLQIVNVILNFAESQDEQFYYMKLEALWIL